MPPEFDAENDGEEEGDNRNDSDVLLSEYDDADSYHDEDEWEMMETGVHDPQPPARAETTLGQPGSSASTPPPTTGSWEGWRSPSAMSRGRGLESEGASSLPLQRYVHTYVHKR